MSAAEVVLQATDTGRGCVRCGTQDTVQLHPRHGRLCARHVVLPTVPPGAYRPAFTDHLVDLGRADAAFAYLAAFLMRSAAERYALASARLVRRCWCGRVIRDATQINCAEHDEARA